MILSLVILGPVLIVALWAFLRFSPPGVPRLRLTLINGAILLIAAFLCFLFTYQVWGNLVGTTDHHWWPLLSALGSAAILAGCLAAGGFLRNLFLRRSAPDDKKDR